MNAERFCRTTVFGAAAPLSTKLIIFSLFLPEGLSFYVLGLRLTVTRLIFLVVTPVLIVRLARSLSSGRYRFVFSDLFVPLTGIWMFLAVSLSQSADIALRHAGPEVLEICIGYMATRFLLTNHGQALSFANLLCVAIAVVALVGLLDPLTGHILVHEWAHRLTGYENAWSVAGREGLYRFGFLRARGPLEQPLLFGLVCSIGLFLALSGRVRARGFVIISCGAGLLAAGESSPVLALVVGLGLLLYGRMLAGYSGRWLGAIAIAAIGIGLIFIVSDNPSTIIVRYLTLNPQTGYFRLWTWGLAEDALHQAPYTGLGFLQFSDGAADLLPTIDNMWLAFAVVYGYPGSVLLGLSIVGSMSLRTSGPRVNLTPEESNLGTALSIAFFMIMIMALTVHIWGADRILMGLLVGMRAHLGALGRLGVGVRPRPLAFNLAKIPNSSDVGQ